MKEFVWYLRCMITARRNRHLGEQKKIRLLIIHALTLIAVNMGLPIKVRTLNMCSEMDRYVIYQTLT